MAKDRFQIDEIASNGEKTIAENIIAYRVAPLLGSMDDEDLICKGNLYGILGNAGSDIFYAAGTLLPIIMVNGVDFITTSRSPLVGITRSEDTDSNTSDGADYNKRWNYTDATKKVVSNIVILDNGTGALEFDIFVRVV